MKRYFVILLCICTAFLTACAQQKTVERGEPMRSPASETAPEAALLPIEDEETAEPEEAEAETEVKGQEPKKPESPTQPPHSHSYETQTVAATCTAGGYVLHKCACGDSYRTDETAALGHDYQTSTVAATADAQGYTLHQCSRCGDSYKDNYTDKILRDYWTLEDGLNPYDPRVKEIAVNYSPEQAQQTGNDYLRSLGLTLMDEAPDYVLNVNQKSMGAEGTQVYLQGGQAWLNGQAKALVDSAVNDIRVNCKDDPQNFIFLCVAGSASPGFYGVSVYYCLKG